MFEEGGITGFKEIKKREAKIKKRATIQTHNRLQLGDVIMTFSGEGQKLRLI